MATLIRNARVVTPDAVLEGFSVLFDKSILAIGQNLQADAQIVPGDGCQLFSGFIDIHIHGAYGADTMDCGVAPLVMSHELASCGITAFLPTTLTASRESTRDALRAVRAAIGQEKGARILGAHMEGPFLSPEYKGAHEGKYLVLPDIAWVRDFTDVIRLISLAPELPGAEELVRFCVENGIVVSIGHSGATYEECVRAVSWGVSSFTHTYNAMSPLRHREPGTVGAALTLDTYAEIICDHVHISPPAQQVFFNSKGAHHAILVTDALRACLLGDGPFTLGNLSGEVKEGRALLKDGTIAGSVLTLNNAVRNFCANTGTNLSVGSRCASLNPATLLGIADRKGSLAIGKDADLTLLDSGFKCISTWVEGRRVFSR